MKPMRLILSAIVLTTLGCDNIPIFTQKNLEMKVRDEYFRDSTLTSLQVEPKTWEWARQNDFLGPGAHREEPANGLVWYIAAEGDIRPRKFLEPTNENTRLTFVKMILTGDQKRIIFMNWKEAGVK